jgi:hypothetical protein
MRIRSLLAAWALVALVAGPVALAGPGAALAAGAEWGTPEAKSVYGQFIEFQQPATLPVGTSRVEILLDFPGGEGPVIVDVGVAVTGTSTILAYTSDTTLYHLYPNTRVGARWRVTLADGTTEVGPRVTMTYADTGFPWKTKTGKVVRLHWYEGSDAFAERALKIGEDAIAKASKVLGVTETEPVDFYAYASQDAFYAAAGPGTRENVGGFALPDIRTLFALISPKDIDAAWVGTVVPHELTHLVFDTAVKNPYHYPPRWLNEGVAVYLSEGNASDYRKDLRKGVADGRILPLEALSGLFPTTADQFFLGYAESVSAVAYIVDTYGQDALVKLIRAYADGVSDDEAFRTGLGVALADVEAGWLASIGAAAPERAGPLPAPVGPVPSDWIGQPGAGASPAPESGAFGASPAPASGAFGASPAPGSSGAAEASSVPAASPTAPAGPADAGRTDAGALLLVVGAFVAAIAVGGALALRSRDRRPPGAPPVPPGTPLWPVEAPGAPSPPLTWPPAPAGEPSGWPPAAGTPPVEWPQPPQPRQPQPWDRQSEPTVAAWPPDSEPTVAAWPPSPQPPAPQAAGTGAGEETQG